jgi:hypothetical protein
MFFSEAKISKLKQKIYLQQILINATNIVNFQCKTESKLNQNRRN